MKNNDLSRKMDQLKHRLAGYGALTVAFSGGVDSTFLLAVSRAVLGDRIRAVVALSPLFSNAEKTSAMGFLEQTGIPFHTVHPPVMESVDFIKNGKDRCYVCKKIMLEAILAWSRSEGIFHVVHGVNLDDLGDYRPGLRAAEELGVTSPLADCGFTKNDIREGSRMLNLPTSDDPSMACLASRIPYGLPVTVEKLRVIETAESVLRAYGIRGARVRHHGDVARIEVESSDFARFADNEMRKGVLDNLKRLGFLHVALDLEGYRQGSLNSVLGQPEHALAVDSIE
jgi:uncharacterized protein